MKSVTLSGKIQTLTVALATVAIVFGLSFLPALAAENATTTAGAEQGPDARKILFNMAEFIATAPALSVTIRSGYDAIQEDGQRIEFGSKRQYVLQRPDRFRVEVDRSDGDHGLFVFDGKAITVYKPEDKVFARVDKNGTVDEIMVYMVKDLLLTMPLARMFLSNFPQSLEKLVTSARYVEENHLFDVPTDHITARSKDVDLQLWIAQGEKPLPRRVVITYKNAPGAPQFWAEMSGWNLSPAFAADSFAFTPPAGTEQIPFLAPVRQKNSLSGQKGDVQ